MQKFNIKNKQLLYTVLFGVTCLIFWALALKAQWTIESTLGVNPISNLEVQGILVFGAVFIFGGGFGLYRVSRTRREYLLQSIQLLSQTTAEAASIAEKAKTATGDLSKFSTDYGSSLQETAAAVEELTATVEKNSDNAKKLADLARSTLESTKTGALTIEKMVSATTNITSSNTKTMEQINDSNQRITEITQLISVIGKKTNVINDIVFQTKLLSFNASVEAARAGEHGRGFAVVAEEIGNLARMSGSAAKEIATLLEDSVKKVKAIVEETKTKTEALVHESNTNVEEGLQVALQCGDVFSEIVTNIGTLSTSVEEIAVASEQQAKGLKQINLAMNQLDQVSHNNLNSARETASVTDELLRSAEAVAQATQIISQAA